MPRCAEKSREEPRGAAHFEVDEVEHLEVVRCVEQRGRDDVAREGVQPQRRPRGQRGEDGSVQAYVVYTQTSGREDGIVQRIESTA